MAEEHFHSTAVDLKEFESLNFKKIIGPDDDRQPVPNVAAMPWRTICALRIVANNGRAVFGTGILLDGQSVLTAAHNIFDHNMGGLARAIMVIPGLDRTQQPFGSHGAASSHLPDTWKTAPAPGNDYGVIKLASPVGPSLVTLPCARLTDDVARITPLVIGGYPTDLDHATRQYFHALVATSFVSDRLAYMIDTTEGQSGSPIIANIPVPTVVGVHISGTDTANFGVRFTTTALADIRTWVAA